MINTGLHYSPTYEDDVRELIAYWEQSREQLPFLVWKDTPTQHFDQVRSAVFSYSFLS